MENEIDTIKPKKSIGGTIGIIIILSILLIGGTYYFVKKIQGNTERLPDANTTTVSN